MPVVVTPLAQFYDGSHTRHISLFVLVEWNSEWQFGNGAGLAVRIEYTLDV
jgi:hypothetical protein